MSFTEAECDAMDAHRERCKDEEHETRCRLNVKAPSGVLIGCARDRGHEGPCVTRSGIRAYDSYPNPRVSALLASLTTFEPSDFAALALAAADQAGASVQEQSKIASALSKHMSDEDYQAHFGEPRRIEPNYDRETAREQYERAAAGRR